MDVSSLIIKKRKTENKPEEETDDFPVSSANKSGLQRDFCSFLLRIPSHLHYWTVEGGIYRERFPTSIIAGGDVPQCRHEQT